MWPLFVAIWVTLSTLVVTTLFNDTLRTLLIHGKVRQDLLLRHRGLLGVLLRLEMRKSGWTYFYLVGAIYNLVIALALVAALHHPWTQHVLRLLQSWTVVDAPSPFVEIQFEVTALIALLAIQDMRRTFESLFVTEFGDAKMHVAVIIVGFAHYLGIAPSVLSVPQSRVVAMDGNSSALLSLAGFALFVYGSFQQYAHNKSLADQKRANGGKHVLPRGRWFDHVLFPLYSTELLIYVAFVLLCGLRNPMVYVVLGWVTVNQSVCAYFGKQWYVEKFRSDEKFPKWTLVPGVW